MIEVTPKDFEQAVLQSAMPVLVDFYADWCGPCRAMVPVMENIAKEFEGRVKVVKCNVDNDASVLVARYGIRGIPTFVLVSGGEAIFQLTGTRSEEELRAAITKHLSA